MEVSYIAAFIGGLISVISPCSIMVIPTFIATIESTQQPKLTTVGLFAIGLWLSLAPLSFGAIFMGTLYASFREPFTLIVGSMLVLLGVGMIGDKYIPIPSLAGKIASKDYSQKASIFMLGIVAGIGATTCIGPMLGAILTLASSQTSILKAVMLVSSYAVGIMVPIVGGSMLFGDKLLSITKSIRSHHIHIRSSSISVYNLLSGIFVIAVGVLIIMYQGSLNANKIPFLSYLLNIGFDIQDWLLR